MRDKFYNLLHQIKKRKRFENTFLYHQTHLFFINSLLFIILFLLFFSILYLYQFFVCALFFNSSKRDDNILCEECKTSCSTFLVCLTSVSHFIHTSIPRKKQCSIFSLPPPNRFEQKISIKSHVWRTIIASTTSKSASSISSRATPTATSF